MRTPDDPAKLPFASNAPPAGNPNRADPRAVGILSFGCSAVVFMSASMILLIILSGFILPAWRADHHYVAASCTVLGGRLDFPSVQDGGRNGAGGGRMTYHPMIHVRLQANGRDVETWGYDAFTVNSYDRRSQQAVVDSFKVGSTHPVWYDPEDPAQIVLVRSSRLWAWLALIVPAALFGIAALAFLCGWMNWKTPPIPTLTMPT